MDEHDEDRVEFLTEFARENLEGYEPEFVPAIYEGVQLGKILRSLSRAAESRQLLVGGVWDAMVARAPRIDDPVTAVFVKGLLNQLAGMHESLSLYCDDLSAFERSQAAVSNATRDAGMAWEAENLLSPREGLRNLFRSYGVSVGETPPVEGRSSDPVEAARRAHEEDMRQMRNRFS